MTANHFGHYKIKCVPYISHLYLRSVSRVKLSFLETEPGMRKIRPMPIVKENRLIQFSIHCYHFY